MIFFYKKKDYFFKKKYNQYYIVNQENGTLIDLNETSFFLWKNLENRCDVSRLVKLLVGEYDIESFQAKIDIEDFLKMAVKSGIVEKVK